MNLGGSNIFRPRARFSSLCSFTWFYGLDLLASLALDDFSHLYVEETKGMEPSGEILADLVIETIWPPSLRPKWYRNLIKRVERACQEGSSNQPFRQSCKAEDHSNQQHS